MPRFISITKAAQLASVSAKEVQEKIDKNLLATTRGHIHIEDFIDCYPDVRIEETDMLSLVEKIKEESFASGAAKQNPELSYSDLKYELHKNKTNADYYRERSRKYEEMLMHLRNNLEELQQKMGRSQKVQGMIHWMDQRINEIRRNE